MLDSDSELSELDSNDDEIVADKTEYLLHGSITV